MPRTCAWGRPANTVLVWSQLACHFSSPIHVLTSGFFILPWLFFALAQWYPSDRPAIVFAHLRRLTHMCAVPKAWRLQCRNGAHAQHRDAAWCGRLCSSPESAATPAGAATRPRRPELGGFPYNAPRDRSPSVLASLVDGRFCISPAIRESLAAHRFLVRRLLPCVTARHRSLPARPAEHSPNSLLGKSAPASRPEDHSSSWLDSAPPLSGATTFSRPSRLSRHPR
jgi:hypothetical protein